MTDLLYVFVTNCRLTCVIFTFAKHRWQLQTLWHRTESWLRATILLQKWLRQVFWHIIQIRPYNLTDMLTQCRLVLTQGVLFAAELILVNFQERRLISEILCPLYIFFSVLDKNVWCYFSRLQRRIKRLALDCLQIGCTFVIHRWHQDRRVFEAIWTLDDFFDCALVSEVYLLTRTVFNEI